MTAHRPVRARDHDTGDHYTTTPHLAARRGDEVLENHPAVDRYGRWLPRTPHQNLTPARDAHGRFTSPDRGIDQPVTGEEEA